MMKKILAGMLLIVETSLERFFCCNTSCDMICFAKVYLGVIREWCKDHFHCAVAFALLTLENGIDVWKRGDYYRMLASSGTGDEIAKRTVGVLNEYLQYLMIGMNRIFKELPERIKEKYAEISTIISTCSE